MKRISLATILLALAGCQKPAANPPGLVTGNGGQRLTIVKNDPKVLAYIDMNGACFEVAADGQPREIDCKAFNAKYFIPPEMKK